MAWTPTAPAGYRVARPLASSASNTRSSRDDSELRELTSRVRGQGGGSFMRPAAGTVLQRATTEAGAESSPGIQRWGDTGPMIEPDRQTDHLRPDNDRDVRQSTSAESVRVHMSNPHLQHIAGIMDPPRPHVRGREGHVRQNSCEVKEFLGAGGARRPSMSDIHAQENRHWTEQMPMSGLVPRKITHAKTQVVSQEEQITEASRERAEACRQYMTLYWRNLSVYLEERRLRVADFTRKLGRKLRENPGKFTARMVETTYIDPFFARETRRLRDRRKRNKLKEFETLVRIGKGGFATVFLIRHRQSGQVYALKRMLKEHIRNTKKLDHVRTERDVMATANERKCLWIPELHSSFQDSTYLYLVMEFLPGGDFRTLISNLGCFPEEDARFYACEMITAIGHLHRMGFVHRDLKPDNFLIDRHGHVKLADFGLSKAGLQEEFRKTMKVDGGYRLTRRTLRAGTNDFARKSTLFRQNRAEQRVLAYSVVGSPDYMAPELLEGEGYSYSVDWWSLGCIVFEMIVGVPPFFGETPDECFVNIANHEQCLLELQVAVEQDEEVEMSADAWDIVLRLLCPADQRLGGGASDPPGAEVSRDPSASAKEVLSVGWFSKPEYSFDVNKVREMAPPFVPNLDADDDLTYFEEVSDSDDDNDDAAPASLEAPEDVQSVHSPRPGTPESAASSTNQDIVEGLLKNRESVMGFTYRAGDFRTP